MKEIRDDVILGEYLRHHLIPEAGMIYTQEFPRVSSDQQV